jgi:hypothetical protein
MHQKLHKAWGIACLCLTLLASSERAALSQGIDEDLPLPRWEKDAPAQPINEEPGSQFNSLLPSDPFANDHLELPPSGPRLSDAPPTLMPGYSELGPTDLSLFLHGSILQSTDQTASVQRPTPIMDLRDLPTELLKGLADAPANEYLMDPQNLTPEVTRIDLERLLEFHSKESLIHFYLLVLDTNQKLPDTAALDQLAHGALTRQKACLAVYPLGEPWRARIFLSPTVHGSVTSAMLTELAADCIQDAHQAQLSSQQLQRYAVRLSTRLFWLEKSLPTASAAPSAASLQEIAGKEKPAGVSAFLSTWALPLGLSGAVLFLLMLALLMRRNRKTPKMVEPTHVWILPDIEVIPRLGGAFSGGTSALISFKS